MAGIITFPAPAGGLTAAETLAAVAPILGGFRGLPFNGPVGDGRLGSATLTTQTLTEKIFQYEDLTINAGQTVTCEASTPGGFICAVSGTLTLAGTLVATTCGAAGSAGGGLTAVGYCFGGGGGAATQAGGSVILPEFGGLWGGTVGNDLLDNQTTATTISHLWRTTGGLTARASTVTSAGNAASGTGYFDWLWANSPRSLLGFGAGGGSTTGGDTGGSGGGCVFILCSSLDFTGTITANGAPGAGVNAGGGGGGQVIIGYRTLVANSGTINVAGGAALGSAGAGATGYSKVFDMRM